jgi:hypothetical protein
MSDLTATELARIEAAAEAEWNTRAARVAFLGRFDRDVDPDGVLAPEERARRVKAARHAYFTELGRRSAQVRWSRARRLENAGERESEIGAELAVESDVDAEPQPVAASETDPWAGFTGRLF